MGKALKVVGSVLVLALAAAGVLVLTLKLYFTPVRIKGLITEYAEKNLKREITLESAYLGPHGFSIRNLKVAEAGGFAKGSFMAAEEFSLLPDFSALLRKQLKIKSVRASGLDLSIVQVSKETYNLSDLLPQQPQRTRKPAPAAPTAKPIGLTISDINVKNARITYLSADRTMAVTLSDMELGLHSLNPQDLFPFETAFTLEVRSPYLNGKFPVNGKGRLSLGGWDPRKGKAEIDSAVLSAGKISCELEGNLTNLVEPDADVRLKVKAFSSSELRPYFPQVPGHILLPSIEAASKLKLTSSNVSFSQLDFRAGPAKGSIKGRVSWDPAFDYSLTADVRAQTPEMDTSNVAKKFHAVPGNIRLPLIDLAASLALSPKKIKVLSAEANAKSLKITAAGEFSPASLSASGGLKFTAGDIGDLAAMYPAFKEYAPSGAAAGSVDLAMSPRGMSLRGQASFSNISASAAGSQLTGLTGSADFTNDRVKADVAGKLDGSPLKISLNAKNYKAHPVITLNADLESYKFKEIPAGKKPSADPRKGTAKPAKSAAAQSGFAFDISGRTRLGSLSHPNLSAGETVLTYNLKNVSDDPARLSGTAAFYSSGGRFDDLYGLASQHKAAKIALYPLIMLGKASKAAKALKLPDFNTIAFTRMEGDYLFQDGTMKIRKSSLNADVADADTTGAVDLVSNSLDLKITARLKKASGVDLSAPLGMTVKGTFDEPSVKPDVKSIIEQPAVKENVQKLLRKLLK